MEEAGGIHSEYTPRGWMKTEKELLIFEQQLIPAPARIWDQLYYRKIPVGACHG